MWSNAEDSQASVVVISLNLALSIDETAPVQEKRCDSCMPLRQSRGDVPREDGELNVVLYRKRVRTTKADVMQGSQTFQRGG